MILGHVLRLSHENVKQGVWWPVWLKNTNFGVNVSWKLALSVSSLEPEADSLLALSLPLISKMRVMEEGAW